MLFMVIETLRGQDGKAIYRRFKARGRMMPDGMTLLHSWFTADLSRCFQVVEATEIGALQRWVAAWTDLAAFEIAPIAAGMDTAAAMAALVDGADAAPPA